MRARAPGGSGRLNVAEETLEPESAIEPGAAGSLGNAKNIVVGFAPLKPAEFVVIRIQQLAGQTQS